MGDEARTIKPGADNFELRPRDGDAGDSGADPLIARGKPFGPETVENRGDLSQAEFMEALKQLKRETDALYKRRDITELPWRPSRV